MNVPGSTSGPSATPEAEYRPAYAGSGAPGSRMRLVADLLLHGLTGPTDPPA
ncbi:hypothetical protein [Nonomuraea sp. NPDC023979]|uniref:hypothetical protein n=1 Tax=Nonomuraea sp. NPDC023979 TaxID=3154796 RepID=UPI0034088409